MCEIQSVRVEGGMDDGSVWPGWMGEESYGWVNQSTQVRHRSGALRRGRHPLPCCRRIVGDIEMLRHVVRVGHANKHARLRHPRHRRDAC